jgi:antitoxin MazE
MTKTLPSNRSGVNRIGLSIVFKPGFEALDLREGDEIEISIAGKRDFKLARDRSKERALEQLRQMKWSFPPDFIFNREKINER